MISISLVTDELSGDPETAIEMAVSWGIRDFELRGYYTDRVPRLSNYQKQQLRHILEDYDARIVALSPGLFKMAYPPKAAYRWSFGCLDMPSYESWSEAHRQVQFHVQEILPATLEYARELGARVVVIFAFSRGGAVPGEPPEEVYQALRLAAERAEAAGVVLAVETEDGYWADTGQRTAAMINKINHPALRVNWDPGNSFCAGETPYPNGYNSLRGMVHHVHFKDARRLVNGTADFVLDGQIDWKGQIEALRQDGYNGYVSIETHLRPKIAAARAYFERLKQLLEPVEVDPTQGDAK
jgi:sugar phosphate isomerase/epimerase